MISMFKKLRQYNHVLFGILFITSICPFVFDFNEDINEQKILEEELYNPNLARLNSIDKIIYYIDSIYALNSSEKFDTAKYVSIISQTVKERFYFGSSNYTLSENWLAYLSGKFLWSHLSVVVNPSDIAKKQHGLCSQQTVVFMEVLKRKGIKERSVGLGYKEGPGHFLCEVYYDNSWHLHDVTMEPLWRNIAHHNNSMEYYLQNKDSLYVTYETRYSKPVFYKLLEKVEYGKINQFPAANMRLLHRFTFFLIYFIPCLFLFLFIRSVFKKYKVKN